MKNHRRDCESHETHVTLETGLNVSNECELGPTERGFQSGPLLCCRSQAKKYESQIFVFILTKMRRTTLGTLNIGNQNRQIVRERKTSLGTRPSVGSRRPSSSGRASLANPRSRFVRNFQVKCFVKNRSSNYL